MELSVELIEHYLEGRLSEAELKAFEERMQSEPAFKEEVEAFRTLGMQLEAYDERRKLKEKLEQFHHELDAEENGHTRKTLKIQLPYQTIAVAASIALVISTAAYWTFDSWSGKEKEGRAYYMELRRDMEQIKKSQNSLIKKVNQAQKPTRTEQFTGTGFALSEQGWIITNYHVIKDADSVSIENDLYPKRRAEIVYVNPQWDIALLKVPIHFKKLPYSFPSKTKLLGDRVFTLGYPREELVYGEGYIGSKTGYDGDTASYQISMPVNPGNSGGPLLDEKGNIVGVVSGKHAQAEGAAFALKIGYVKTILNAQDAVTKDLHISWTRYGAAASLSRSEQIRKAQDFVFKIRVYE